MVLYHYNQKLLYLNSLISSNLNNSNTSLYDVDLFHNPNDINLMNNLKSIPDLKPYDVSKLNKLIEVYNFKNVNKLFLEFAFKLPLATIHKNRMIANSFITHSRLIIHKSRERINNLSYDLFNIKNYPIYSNSVYPIPYSKDFNQYTFINKKKRYLDLDIRKILKRLLVTHSINTFEYKDSIKRLNYNQVIKDRKSILNHILQTSYTLTLYRIPYNQIFIIKPSKPKIKRFKTRVNTKIKYHILTMRARTNKNTITALNDKEDKRYKHIVTAGNGYTYMVLCKKYPYYIDNVINTEFDLKLHHDNKFKIIV